MYERSSLQRRILRCAGLGLAVAMLGGAWSWSAIRAEPTDAPAAPATGRIADENAGKSSPGTTITDEQRRHWAFQPLDRRDPPSVTDETWCRTPIDRFVRAKLEERGIAPNPPADRRTLIRRAYFDLIGLPPTPDEVEAFVNDSAPDAYEKRIDRLLENPHYGERWGRHWLDVARFAESHGYEQDYDRPNAYHYRDFVIKALNMNLPYDTFVKWQIAGDEFEPEAPLALMATGFLAAGTHATQITANQAEKERYDELDDKLRTIGTTMLGLTLGCARCHDHKYDPIPTSDYYRLIATFSTTVRSDYDVNLDPEGYRRAKEAFDSEHAPFAAAVAKSEKDELPSRLGAWLKQPGSLEPARWTVLDVVSQKSEGGAAFTKLDDGSLLAAGTNPEFDTYTFVAHTKLKGITAIRVEALAHPTLVKGGPGRAENGNFALTDLRVTTAPLAPLAGRGAGGEGSAANAQAQPVAVKLVHPKATFEQSPTLSVAAVIDADKKSGWAIDPQFGRDHAAVFQLEEPVGYDGGTVLTFTLEFKNNKGHNIGRPRLSVATAPPPVELGGESMPEKVAGLLAKLRAEGGQLADDERPTLLAWYRTIDPEWQRLNQTVQEHLARAPKPKLAKALICSEGVPAVRTHTQGLDFYDPTYHLKRGDPNQKGEVATQGFLQVLMRSADGEKRWQFAPPEGWRTSYRRRALANWLTDVDHGAGHLLARVIVNRLWYHHMGRGIVATPSDFGSQGARPTHSELLDWLANELVRSGWRLKPMHKLIMTCAVYMQSAGTDERRLAADRDNTLYWHRPVRRLEGEIIRDAMLAASGSLDATQFGPGTLDPKQRRRSIYFFVKRSQLVPMMVLFDGPDTLQDLPCRSSTTIAPQALMLLNNATVRDYAANFAGRLKPQACAAPDLAGAVRAGYAIAFGRPPRDAELAEAVAFLQQQIESYQADGKPDATDLALADLCQTLMSVNEFVYVK